MSMTIGGNTVHNPAYDKVWQRERQQIGAPWAYLDGSRGGHHITAQWGWSLVWRVVGKDYTDLMTALLAVEGVSFTLTDHLGNSETCMLDGNPRDRLDGNVVHEVTASFVETTA
jgi:hypothetical protein